MKTPLKHSLSEASKYIGVACSTTKPADENPAERQWAYRSIKTEITFICLFADSGGARGIRNLIIQEKDHWKLRCIRSLHTHRGCMLYHRAR